MKTPLTAKQPTISNAFTRRSRQRKIRYRLRILLSVTFLALSGATDIAEAAEKDPTPKCGGPGQKACEYRRANKVGSVQNIACTGKNVHLAVRNGECRVLTNHEFDYRR